MAGIKALLKGMRRKGARGVEAAGLRYRAAQLRVIKVQTYELKVRGWVQ